MEMKIDPEFETRIPPLTEDEFRNLEENILAAGEIYSPIIVWNGTIVDGHNRYRILKKHPELKYSVKEISFSDRGEALSWICENQLGRRNLSPMQKKYLLGIQYKAQKMSHGGNRRNAAFSSDKNDHLKTETTRQRLARVHGVSEAYIQHCADYADGVNYAESIRPGLGKKLIGGEVKLTQRCVEGIVKVPERERSAYIEDAMSNTSGPRENKKKSLLNNSEKKKETILDDEVSVAFQTAMDEFIQTWEDILDTKDEWREGHRELCVYLVGSCSRFLEGVLQDYFYNFFEDED